MNPLHFKPDFFNTNSNIILKTTESPDIYTTIPYEIYFILRATYPISHIIYHPIPEITFMILWSRVQRVIQSGNSTLKVLATVTGALLFSGV
jgi:hypothetical protein